MSIKQILQQAEVLFKKLFPAHIPKKHIKSLKNFPNNLPNTASAPILLRSPAYFLPCSDLIFWLSADTPLPFYVLF